MNFPEDLNAPNIEIIAQELIFDTPYGESPPFKIFAWGNTPEEKVLTCSMHGWRSGVSRRDGSLQVFWVFKKAGVKKIISEGGVGSLNYLLDPRDVVIVDDYIDFSMRKDVGLGTPQLLIMRQALCPSIREILVDEAKKVPLGRVFSRGVYVVTDGRHFESPAEVAMLRQWNGDVVGQSLCPEVYLAREIGACYAGLYTVVNYGEGLVKDWDHEELSDIFHNDAIHVGRVILNTLKNINIDSDCGCKDLVKHTLLKKVYK
jgi:5'-methylthioadenosine phosphorylase